MSTSSSPKSSKRNRENQASISPPPVRRKLQSGTTQNAVASFFTPASQKAPPKMIWQERGANQQNPNTLIVGKFDPDSSSSKRVANKRRKVAAFDFDSTLITTSSGKKFASDAQDWKWWHSSVPTVLKRLYHEDGYQVVVLSNQAGISFKADNKGPRVMQTKYSAFKTKVTSVFQQLDFPITIYAATEKDIYRKPRTGMWQELLDDHDITSEDLDLEDCIFVGDAGGRDSSGSIAKDFSCSDRNFADNVGIKFETPEEFFLNEPPRTFTRTFDPSGYITEAEVKPFAKMNDQDIILFCGSPGAGKSTFYWRFLQPLGYERVNQDTLKSRDRCIKVANDLLKAGNSVAVDNTNADTEVRSKWIDVANKHGVPIRCIHFTTSTEACFHNDAVRALNASMNPEKRTILPSLAFRGFASKFQPPKTDEGFQDVVVWDFKFVGTESEKAIWSRHWT